MTIEILGALLAGAFIGSVLGFIGAGGAMLAVPILIYIFAFTPHHATTASLAVVGLAAASGVLTKIRSREVLYREAIIIWAIGLITNLGFSSISDQLPDRFITTGFAIVLALAGLSMIRNPLSTIHTRMPLPILILVSLLIGSITGLFGIGGGFLAIPILVLFFGTPQIVAAGTSLLIIAMNSLTALLGRAATWDEIDWHVPILMGLSAIIISNIASRKASKSTPASLKSLFAVFLLSLALFTLIESWVF
jgi:uncharacterized membrane protein YfcA